MSLIKVDYGEVGGGNDTPYMIYWYASATYYLTMLNTESDVYARQGTSTSNISYEDEYIKITSGSGIHAQTLTFKKNCTVINDNTGNVNIPYAAGSNYPFGINAYPSLPLIVKFD